MKKSFFIAILIGASLFLTTGCNIIDNGNVKEESISVKKDKAKELDVDLNLGVGEMTVKQGTNEWVKGNISYNNKHLKPKVSYDLNGTTGKVQINQTKKHFSNVKIGKKINKWNLELSNKVPINLDVNTGASKTNLDLQGLNLKKLDIETGVGELNVNLGGDWKHNLEANIETGVGKTTITVPSDIGVKIVSSKGIGKSNVIDLISKGNGVFVNEAYKDATVIMTVNMDMGIGEVTFNVE